MNTFRQAKNTQDENVKKCKRNLVDAFIKACVTGVLVSDSTAYIQLTKSEIKVGKLFNETILPGECHRVLSMADILDVQSDMHNAGFAVSIQNSEKSVTMVADLINEYNPHQTQTETPVIESRDTNSDTNDGPGAGFGFAIGCALVFFGILFYHAHDEKDRRARQR